MHLYYILVPGMFLTLPIIDFAVAAPVLVRKKAQAGVGVVHMSEDATTMLGKRAGGLDKLIHELSEDLDNHFIAKPESSVTRPSSSSQSPGLADGSTDVEQPVTPIPEEPSQVSTTDRAPPRADYSGGLKKMWLNTFGHSESDSFAKPDESSVTRPSSGSQSSEPAGGSMTIEKLLPSMSKEPSQMSSPDRASLSTDDSDGLMKMWLNTIGYSESHSFAKPDESSVTSLSSSSQSLGSAGGSIVIKKPQPSIFKEPSQVSSPNRAPPSADDSDGLMKMWLKIIGYPESHSFAKPEESSAARPSSSSQPAGPADGSTDVEQLVPSIPEEPLQMTSPSHASLGVGNGLNKMQPINNLVSHPEESLATRPSSSSHPPPMSSPNYMSWLNLFGNPGSYLLAKPGESSAVHWRKPLGLQPADGWTDVKQPLPSIPEEPPSQDDESNKLWPNFFGRPWSYFLVKPGQSAAVSWPSKGLKPLLSIPKKPPSQDDGSNKLWPNFFGRPGSYFLKTPEQSSAVHWHPSSSSKPLPSIPEKPPPVSSSDNAPPSLGDESNKLLPNLFGRPGSYFLEKPRKSSVVHWHPSSSSQPLPSIPEEPSPVSHPDAALPSPGSLTKSGYELMKADAPGPDPASWTMSPADHGLMGAHALPNLGPLTESDHEVMGMPPPPGSTLPIESDHEMDAPPSSSVLSTNPYPKWMDAGSSSGKRKRPWGA